jgi:serine protease AprX
MLLTAQCVRPLVAALLVTALAGLTSPRIDAVSNPSAKLDSVLRSRAAMPAGRTRVIVQMADADPDSARAVLEQFGGTARRRLRSVNGWAGDVPNTAIAALAAWPAVAHVSIDRLVAGTMERTAATVGALPLRETYGYDGTGIGVALIDSGVTSSHDDLADAASGTQRVARFVDLVGGRTTPYDDCGHGTHVAGIVAGNGFDSSGARAGIAPGARLVVLKALDATGKGSVSDVIAAIDYVVAHRTELNIRVLNLSLAAATVESYETDPLTLAAKTAVSQGIVVVAAAGNAGTRDGRTQYGAIGAPGNAPWVLTVGASSHAGTIDRADDSIAAFSSRGPAAGGYAAKPDVVAPGVGIESLSDPQSAFYSRLAPYLLSGTTPTAYLPYLSLSGTSMAAPVVSGTVALMLQANPALSPNQVKAMLQFTAQVNPAYDPLTEGAGFLNARGAVELARHFAAPLATAYPSTAGWSGRIIWGNRLFEGGRLTPSANAWSTGVLWGALTTPRGRSVSWGEICSGGACDTAADAWTAWDVSDAAHNVVWGALCGGHDCSSAWSVAAVLGTTAEDTVVWGMNADTVVWGMDDTVVWGMDDTVVWGMDDTVVWGMACADVSCVPVIWSSQQ